MTSAPDSSPAKPNGLSDILRRFRASCRALVLTDIAFIILAFVVLTPLVGLVFRTLIAASGSAVLSDVDIAMFFLGPVGWVCAVLIGAIWLGIIAMEQTALLGVLRADEAGERLGPIDALRFAAAQAWPVLRLTGRMIAFTLLAAAPFACAIGFAYFSLLTDHDINYYLSEKPPVFRVALAIAAVIVAGLAGVLLWLFSGWFFALPMVLFEGVAPGAALKASAGRASGRRRSLIGWIAAWVLTFVVLSAIGTALVGFIGRLLLPDSTDSLRRLAASAGITLMLWALVNTAIALLSRTTFAAMLMSIYRARGADGVTPTRGDAVIATRPDDRPSRLTRGRLAAAAIIGVLIAIAIGATAMGTVQTQDNVSIMAHRGSSKAAPENTMASFRQAIEDGADWIELDVQETADGEVVVLHDSDFMKLVNEPMKIWDAKVADLADLDIGTWFAPDFAAERVPTLAEVLELCKGKVRVNIELKYYGHDERLEERVAQIVEQHGMSDQVMAMSLKMGGVKKMKTLRPEWKVGLLMSVVAGDLDRIDADFLAVNARFANRQLIRRAHEAGKEVYVWTVNDAPTMSAMISRGADGLLTDKPALARSVLEQRAAMSTPERLLLELASVLGVSPEIEDQ